MAVLDLLLPRVCTACDRLLGDRDRGLICGACWTRAIPLASPRCDRCGHPLGLSLCHWCDGLPPFVRAGRSAYWIPGGTTGSIVHALKYRGWRPVAEEMADRMLRLTWPDDVREERSGLVPVPLSPARERERGFNQSELLARSLGARWSLPVWADVLIRTRATETQTRLTPEERRRNVSGAFAARAASRGRLRGAHVMLVDDVVTTGATLCACASALFDAGARIVSFVTFGRAPSVGDHA
ncbi:MAG: ComF family protein [Gemmatimonadota bacterium]|nr:ComF family protein [Gemmatimonadota bacterium]